VSLRQSQVRKANDDHIQKYLTSVPRQEKWAPQRQAPQRRRPTHVSVCVWHPRHATPEAVSTPAPTACLRGQYLRASTVAQHTAKRNREHHTGLRWRELGRRAQVGQAPNRAVEELVGGHIIASRVHSLGCPLTTSSMGVKAMQTTLRGILLVALVAVVHGDEEDGHELGANEVCACVCGAWCGFPAHQILTINCAVVVGTHAVLRLLTGGACFIVLRCTVQMCDQRLRCVAMFGMCGWISHVANLNQASTRTLEIWFLKFNAHDRNHPWPPTHSLSFWPRVTMQISAARVSTSTSTTTLCRDGVCVPFS
jgi:hypothetical protein